ncbi:hypothetical protein EON68_02765 [archaeon]|nr:MAG: hypothetical protein EON68_02765 [archaeon]
MLTAPRYEDQLGAHRAASIVHYVDSRTALAFEERQSVGELVRNLLLQDAVSGSAAQSMDDMAATGGSAASMNSLKRVTTAPVSLINARFTQHTAASAAALRASGRVAVRGVPAFANAAAVVTKQALAPTQACDGSLTAAALMPDAASRAYWSTHSGVLSPSPAAAMRTLSLMHSPYTSAEAPAAAAAAIPGVAVAAGGGVDGGSTSFLHSAVSRSGVDAATERSALSASSTPLSNSMFERLMQSSRPVELLQAFAQSLSASSRDGGVVTTSAGGAPDNGSTRHGTRPLDAAALRKGEASGFDDDEYGGSVRTGGSEVVGDADSPHNAAWEAAGGIDGFASHIAQLEANWGSSSSASASAGVGARTEIGSVRAPTTVSGMRGWVAAAPPPTVPPARRGGGGNGGGGSRGRVAHR